MNRELLDTIRPSQQWRTIMSVPEASPTCILLNLILLFLTTSAKSLDLLLLSSHWLPLFLTASPFLDKSGFPINVSHDSLAHSYELVGHHLMSA